MNYVHASPGFHAESDVLTYYLLQLHNYAASCGSSAQVGERSKATQKNHICVRVFQVLLQEKGIALEGGAYNRRMTKP